MNPKHLEAFRAVMRTGSMSVAAGTLHVSPPTLSRLLGELEASTGIKFFDRRQGKFSPRLAAWTFYAEVEKVFLGENYLRRIAAEIRANVAIRLTLGAFPAFGLSQMPPLVAAFHEKYPEVSLTLDVNSTQRLAIAVASGAADVVVVGEAPVLSGMEKVADYAAPWVCVLRVDDRLAALDVIDMGMLDHEKLIWLDNQPPLPTTGRATSPLATSPCRGALVVPHADTACRLVALGHGIAIIDPITALLLPVKDLVIRRLSPEVMFKYSLLRSMKMLHSEAGTALIQLLHASCSQLMAAWQTAPYPSAAPGTVVFETERPAAKSDTTSI